MKLHSLALAPFVGLSLAGPLDRRQDDAIGTHDLRTADKGPSTSRPFLKADRNVCGNSNFSGHWRNMSSEACQGTLGYCFSKSYAVVGAYGQRDENKESASSPSQCLRDRGVDIEALETKPVDKHWWDIDALKRGEDLLRAAYFTYERSALVSILFDTLGSLKFDDSVLKAIHDSKNFPAEHREGHGLYIENLLQAEEKEIRAKINNDEEALRLNASMTIDQAKQEYQKTFRPEFMSTVSSEIDKIHQCLRGELGKLKAEPLMQTNAPPEISNILRAASAFHRRQQALENLHLSVSVPVLEDSARRHLEFALEKVKGLPERAELEQSISDARKAVNKKWTDLDDGYFFRCRLDRMFRAWSRHNVQEWDIPE